MSDTTEIQLVLNNRFPPVLDKMNVKKNLKTETINEAIKYHSLYCHLYHDNIPFIFCYSILEIEFSFFAIFFYLSLIECSVSYQDSLVILSLKSLFV